MRTADTGYPRNAYFKFTVSGVTGPVTSAKMRVKTGPVTFPNATVSIIDNSWNEFTVTWNNAPLDSFFQYGIGRLPADSWVEIEVSSIVTGNGTYTIGMVAPDIPNLCFRSRQSTEKPTLHVTFPP